MVEIRIQFGGLVVSGPPIECMLFVSRVSKNVGVGIGVVVVMTNGGLSL